MTEIKIDEAIDLAKSRLAGIPGMNLGRPDVQVGATNGRLIVVPTEKPPVENIEELAKGAIVGAVNAEFAQPGAFLKDGSYSVKVLRDHGTWVSQFIQEGKVVASTTQVRVVEISGVPITPTSERGSPVAVVFGDGNYLFIMKEHSSADIAVAGVLITIATIILLL
ncbi:MAG: hypothetical protein EF812_00525 [Methanosarcinales archaeon]|nr:MAG: hypothetical protein EF812_00525 [Methanosarcinales archaeon]